MDIFRSWRLVGWLKALPSLFQSSPDIFRVKAPSGFPIESKHSRSLELGSLELGSVDLGIDSCSLQSSDFEVLEGSAGLEV